MPGERTPWTRLEVEAAVADYLDMLVKELQGEAFDKAEHNRLLRRRLPRSKGSVEYKHRNISAVLIELGLPYIEGYKPAGNYQGLLVDVVQSHAASAKNLLDLVTKEVAKPAAPPTVDDILSRLVAAPPAPGDSRTYGAVHEPPPHLPGGTNYLMREALNSSLGAAGERFVLNYETARLLAAGREKLASRIEHVSATQGDHVGFDILSFEPDGREKHIEVKTTAFGAFTPFFVSANQVRRSRIQEESYHVYRVFRFRRDPRVFALPGAIDRSVYLQPTEYLARVR
jgi:hypothetical protein